MSLTHVDNVSKYVHFHRLGHLGVYVSKFYLWPLHCLHLPTDGFPWHTHTRAHANACHYTPPSRPPTPTRSTLKDGFGFIKCADREARLFFHFSEVIENPQRASLHRSQDSRKETLPTAARVGASVEFIVQSTPAPSRASRGGCSPSSRSSRSSAGKGKAGDPTLHAVQVCVLPPGTVQFETMSTTRFEGKVLKRTVYSCPMFSGLRGCGTLLIACLACVLLIVLRAL